jgi:hypothetical protein
VRRKKVKRNHFQDKISKRRLKVRVKGENEISIKERKEKDNEKVGL